MSNQFKIESGSLDPTFRGTWQDFADSIPDVFAISLSDGKALFTSGANQPSGNQGPWLKDGDQWFVYDITSGGYIPAKINPLFRRTYIQLEDPVDGIEGNEEDDTTESVSNGQLWIKTDEDGNYDSLHVRLNNTWETITYPVDDRAEFLAIIADFPSYVQEQVSNTLSGIENSIAGLQAQITAIGSISAPKGVTGPKGPTGDAGPPGDGATLDITAQIAALNEATNTLIGLYDISLPTDDQVTTETDWGLLGEILSFVGDDISFEAREGIRILATAVSELTELDTAIAASQEEQLERYEASYQSALELNSGGGITGESREIIKASILNLLYPVGMIYENKSDSRNPNDAIGWPEINGQLPTWVPMGSGRFLVGAGSNGVSSFSAGFFGGSHEHKLLNIESAIASHTHEITRGKGFTRDGGSRIASTNQTSPQQETKTDFSFGADAEEAHDNMPPYLTVYRWVRTQ